MNNFLCNDDVESNMPTMNECSLRGVDNVR
jgi:hypothetical protein